MTIDFEALGISKKIVDILSENRITEPTAIQEQTITKLLEGKDIIAQAQTGTGKTLAFLLPIMENIDVSKLFIQALIITPTRELAIQITNEAKRIAKAKGVNILAVYGGQDVEKQLKKLKSGVHIVIGTPGRLLDHIRRKSIELGSLNMLVLDEADEMLNMGFLKDVEEIISVTPKRRQTMLFSATMPKQIRSLAKRFMTQPVQIQVQRDNVTLDEIEQIVIETTDRGKEDTLCKAIDEFRPFLAIIFCRTKRRVKKLNSALQSRGYNSDEIHGDLSQAKREKVIKSFKKMDIQFLVATDVAARGLDIEGVTHIFNYDVPENTDSYIHRIGRTGRAGQRGIAITFVTPKDRDALKDIERRIKMTIKTKKITVEKEKQNNKSNRIKDEGAGKGSLNKYGKKEKPKKKSKIRNIHEKKNKG